MVIAVTRIGIDKITARMPLLPRARRIEDPTLTHESAGCRGFWRTWGTGRHFCCRDGEREETGRLPVSNSVIVPARESVLRVGTKPGTEVPPVENGGRWDAIETPSRHANLEIIGLSTPEMGITGACSSIRAPGRATAVCATLKC